MAKLERSSGKNAALPGVSDLKEAKGQQYVKLLQVGRIRIQLFLAP